MPTLIYTIGLPAAGKDYYYHNFYNTYTHISSDQLRIELFNNVNDLSHNDVIFNTMQIRTHQALLEGKDVYYNATNLSAKRRINFLKSLRRIPDLKKIALLIVPPIEFIKVHNRQRERVVPEYVIDRMIKNFQPPHLYEGWDQIIISGNEFIPQYIQNIIEESCYISHDNPHHKLSIGQHMLVAGDWANAIFQGKPFGSEIIEAAYCHDVGKIYCKTFKNYNGEESKIAHYYGHENVSAYIYLSTSAGEEKDLFISNLIFHHMDFFKGDKYIEKMKKNLGEDFWGALEKLHTCDAIAH